MTKPPTEAESPIDQQLVIEVDEALRRYSEFGPGCPQHLAEAIRYGLLAPGKRLRPLLVLLAARACGGPPQAALPAACAVEMIHTYSLIHDDLPAMDDDDMRRGQPSCHIAFGEDSAILAGDALLARAFEVLAGDIRPSTAALACCRELAHAAGPTRLVGGQADDLTSTAANTDSSLLQSIHRRKTGALFVVSMRLGGIVAGADEPRMARLTEFGTNLGLAFQITDDLLDEEGEEAALGKHTRKDAQRGKATFPRLYGIDESRRRASELIDAACAAVAELGADADDLQRLARFVLLRQR